MNELDEMIATRKAIRLNGKNKNVNLFRPTNRKSMTPPKKLFGALWAHCELVYLFAVDGAGKSILAIQIAWSIASGKAINGFDLEVEAQPVCVIDAELSDYQFNARYPGELPENLYRFTFAEDQQTALVGADIAFVVDQIANCADSCNAKIIILDNLSALMSMADLTKTSESIQLMGQLNELKKKGYSVMVIDHTRKPMHEREGEFKMISKNDLQGSKMKSNLTDSAFSIGKSCQNENLRYIKALKIRSFPFKLGTKEVATVELKTGPLRFDFVGLNAEWEHVNDRAGEVQKMANDGLTQKQIAEKFGITQQAVSKKLNEVPF